MAVGVESAWDSMRLGTMLRTLEDI